MGEQQGTGGRESGTERLEQMGFKSNFKSRNRFGVMDFDKVPGSTDLGL